MRIISTHFSFHRMKKTLTDLKLHQSLLVNICGNVVLSTMLFSDFCKCHPPPPTSSLWDLDLGTGTKPCIIGSAPLNYNSEKQSVEH